jgi:hypothetical protein
MNYYSNIYWHFTGSPENIDWSKVKSPKEILDFGMPKDDNKSIEVLFKILESKVLLATCKEMISEDLYTSKFCCVTDIPIQNLSEHRKYYGNIAIGFKSTRIQENFNPVLYISPKNLRYKVKFVNNEDYPLRLFNKTFGSRINKEKKRKSSPFNKLFKVEKSIDTEQLGNYIFHHFKITNFSDNSNDTFYREREWRRLSDFEFDIKDIASFIVPEIFVNDVIKKLSDFGIANIPLLTWEFIERI